MSMKKIIIFMLCLSIVAFAGCSTDNKSESETTTIAAVATSQPEPSKETEPVSLETKAEEEEGEVKYEITYQGTTLWGDSITRCEAIIEITNTGNIDLYIDDTAFDLEDADGNLVKSSSTPYKAPYIIPIGGKGYVFDALTLSDVSPDTELTVVPHITLEKAKSTPGSFPVTDVEIKNSDTWGLVGSGMLENKTAEQEQVTVDIVCYDSDGKPLTIIHSLDLGNTLAAGEKKEFSGHPFLCPDGLTVENIASYTAYGFVMESQY